MPGGEFHNFADFFSLPNPLKPQLERQALPHLDLPDFKSYPTAFKAIKERDWILHFPYQSYNYVLDFLREAAYDKKVERIMVTQYRVASNSAVVNTLIAAAKSGKQVTVFVEVKARFDEENNLLLSREMQKAGVKVIWSIPGIKVHAKVAMVVRNSGTGKDEKKQTFVFLATGNFNEKTAKLYADHGFFTANEAIAEEAQQLFQYLENQEFIPNFQHILVGKFNLRTEFVRRIDREIEQAKKGEKAYLLLKMNGLEDRNMIKKLYEASEAGVKINLLVRGVCCLIPDEPFSKNITITRIVDSYLEHARVYVFYNGGENETFISSADWMKRNLSRRIETAIPIKDPRLKKEILDILNIQLKANVKSYFINKKLENIAKSPSGEPIRAQYEIQKYCENLLEKSKQKQ